MSGHSIRLRDDPWQRLPWLLPLALLVTALSQMGFLLLLRQPSAPPAAPRPVSVQVVELPVSVSPKFCWASTVPSGRSSSKVYPAAYWAAAQVPVTDPPA